jgi:rhamnulokinase
MTQAIASGEVESIAQARDVIRNSFEVEEYQPQDTAVWDDAYEKYLKIVG